MVAVASIAALIDCLGIAKQLRMVPRATSREVMFKSALRVCGCTGTPVGGERAQLRHSPSGGGRDDCPQCSYTDVLVEQLNPLISDGRTVCDARPLSSLRPRQKQGHLRKFVCRPCGPSSTGAARFVSTLGIPVESARALPKLGWLDLRFDLRALQRGL
jgi:hypothetical protein